MQSRREAVAKWLAVALGTANAAVTAYWLAGGTVLLSTVGGEIEEWGRRRTAGVLGVLGLVLLVKTAVAAAPLLLDRLHQTRLDRSRLDRLGRSTAWVAALVLTSYGGLLTAVGLVVQVGVVSASTDADGSALAWHTYLWDPWFLAWGIALGSWLWLSNHGDHRPRAKISADHRSPDRHPQREGDQ